MPETTAPKIPLRQRTDCEAMEPPQRRAHYSYGCRSDLCRAAASAASKDRYAATKKKTSGGANGSASTRSSESRPGGTGATIRTPEPTAVTRTEPAPPEDTPKPAPPRPNLVAATGAVRRLQGLVAFGYTPKQLAEHAGLPVDAVWWMLIDPPQTIQAVNHAAIATMFKQLRDQPYFPDRAGQVPAAAARAYHLAERHEWLGAYDWEDVDFDTRPAYRRKPFQDQQQLVDAIAHHRLDDTTAAPDAGTGQLQAELDTARSRIHHLEQQLAEAAKQHVTVADTITRLRADLATAPAAPPVDAGIVAELRKQVDAQSNTVSHLERDNASLRADQAPAVTADHGIHIHLNLADLLGRALGAVDA